VDEKAKGSRRTNRNRTWDPVLPERRLPPEAARSLPGMRWLTADAPPVPPRITRRAVRDAVDAMPVGARLANGLLARPADGNLWSIAWEACMTVGDLSDVLGEVRQDVAARARTIAATRLTDVTSPIDMGLAKVGTPDIFEPRDRTALAYALAADDDQIFSRLEQMIARLGQLARRGVRAATAGELLRLRITLVDDALGAASWTQTRETDLPPLHVDEVAAALEHLRRP
jgi:hypothetical protein